MGHVLQVFDFCWVRLDTFCHIGHSKEADGVRFDGAFPRVEYQPVLGCYLHEVVQHLVMLCVSFCVDGYVVGDADCSIHLVQDLVHFHFEDVLGYVKARNGRR